MKQFRRRKSHEMQQMIRLYREKYGVVDVDMREVAKLALDMGWRMPPPVNQIDRLAKELARAAREETRYDAVTKRPYRVNHAYPGMRDGAQISFWTDIDQAPRGPMHMSLTLRRQQMVDDGFHLSLDADHWNSIHPENEPIRLVFDFTDDIEERKNVPPDEQDQAS